MSQSTAACPAANLVTSPALIGGGVGSAGFSGGAAASAAGAGGGAGAAAAARDVIEPTFLVPEKRISDLPPD
jgi:hypothetical protein